MQLFDRVKPILADDTVFYGLLILLVALVSFGLGRLSVGGSSFDLSGVAGKTGMVTMTTSTPPAALVAAQSQPGGIAPVAAATGASTTSPNTTKPYVASKNGTKYYLTTCASANRIAIQNRVYFASVGEAQATGLTPAANCPGL